MTKLGIISDTHGNFPLAQNAVKTLEGLEVDVVLHCGDIGTPDVVALFSKWQTHFVLGNCDHDVLILEAAIREVGGTYHGAFGELAIEGVRIALLHSHDRRRFVHSLSSGDYDLVCYGHTHVAATDRHGETLAVNPGAVHRANRPSVAYIELPQLETTIVPLSPPGGRFD